MTNKLVVEDFWEAEDFEDTVASVLIACFETKILKNHGAPPADRMTEERLRLFRNSGPYIASNSRLYLAPEEVKEGEKERWFFDLQNDPLPVSGCLAMKTDGKLLESEPGAYVSANYVRKATALGEYWHRQSGGQLYEFLRIAAQKSGGISGERCFFTVDANGEIHSCIQRIDATKGRGNRSKNIIESDAPYMNETEAWGSTVLQALADRRFCWTITAEEQDAKADLGCMQEEVKSLLYARSLPMTATGRKRPILHLIESHKRRLRNGIEIDITSFLRGTQVIEMNGTVFKVNAPSSLKNRVSSNSQKKYF